MSESLYKVGEPIKVVYQAPNAESGLTTVKMEILDELSAPSSDFPDVMLTEIGNSGRYEGSFEPDAVGDWAILVEKAPGLGEVVKHYPVGPHNITSIGGKIDAVSDKVDASEDGIRGADGDTLKTLSDQLDSASSPPMVS